MDRNRRPEPATASPRDELLFCAMCQVSVSAAEVERGEALRTPKGRTFCGVCVTATPEERQRRREELEIEFADDAPVPFPAPIPAARRAAEPPPVPAPAAGAVLAARVGELERSAFRQNARIEQLEERLAAVLRRLET